MAGGYVLTTAISRFGVPFPLALALAFAFVAATTVLQRSVIAAVHGDATRSRPW